MRKPYGRSRKQTLLQLLIGWLPIWGLIASLIAATHATGIVAASLISLRMVFSAAIVARAVQRVTEELPWRTPVRLSFVGIHLLAALAFALIWIGLNSLITSLFHRAVVIVVGVGLPSFILLGIWLYVIIAGVSYTMQSTQRAAMAEATAARAQLSALRSQLNPHFLFNALHTVVQLIPKHPHEAAQAAVQVAGLLRTTIEEDRDVVSVSEEIAFVERYLDIERIRFGDRLAVIVDIPAEARSALMPSFALQTLVENAVRHGATPKVEATEVKIAGRIDGEALVLSVNDDGVGATAQALSSGTGTGLRRLRERLSALYGTAASLDVGPNGAVGICATMKIPQEPAD